MHLKAISSARDLSERWPTGPRRTRAIESDREWFLSDGFASRHCYDSGNVALTVIKAADGHSQSEHPAVVPEAPIVGLFHSLKRFLPYACVQPGDCAMRTADALILLSTAFPFESIRHQLQDACLAASTTSDLLAAVHERVGVTQSQSVLKPQTEDIIERLTSTSSESDSVGEKGGIPLVEARERGRPTYVPQLDMNLFRPLLPEVRQAFSEGDGGELAAKGEPAKMQALHSSSALAVNVFQYWKQIAEVPVIAAACGLCQPGSTSAQDLVFEEKYPVNEAFEKSPNINVVIHNREESRIRRLAIECKSQKPTAIATPQRAQTRYLEECGRSGKTFQRCPSCRNHFTARQAVPHLTCALIQQHPRTEAGVGRTGFRSSIFGTTSRPDGDLHHKRSRRSPPRLGDGVMFHSLTSRT